MQVNNSALSNKVGKSVEEKYKYSNKRSGSKSAFGGYGASLYGTRTINLSRSKQNLDQNRYANNSKMGNGSYSSQYARRD